MRKIMMLAAAVLCSLPLFAENDSTNFCSGNWKISKVCDGVTLKQCSFEGNLFNSPQFISVLEVSGKKVDVVEAPAESLVKTSVLAEEYKAVAAISLAIVGSYTVVKLVDKFFGASVVVNADNRKVEG